jgi:hypothetical protein
MGGISHKGAGILKSGKTNDDLGSGLQQQSSVSSLVRSKDAAVRPRLGWHADPLSECEGTKQHMTLARSKQCTESW